jgi:hypothetical protein
MSYRQCTMQNSRSSFSSVTHRAGDKPSVPTGRASSLVHSLSGSSWGHTLTSELDPVPVTPFRNPLRGLVMEELDDPEVFRLFFE